MVEQFANNATSTLNGAINNSVTTIVVTSGSSFPSTGNFRLLIGSNASTGEIVLVTARSSNTLTVVRGQEGTTAQSWSDATTVTHILTAGAVYTLQQTLRGKTLDTSLSSIGSSQDGYALTWLNTDGYWAARPASAIGIMRSGSGDPNAIKCVQGISSAGISATFTSNVTTGNIIVAMIQTEGSISSVGSVTISDTRGTSYTAVQSSIGNSGGVNAIVYIGTVTGSGSCTVTANHAASFARTTIVELAGITSITPDSSAVGYEVSTLNVTNSSTPSYIMGFATNFHSGTTYTPGSGFAQIAFGNGSDASFIEAKVVYNVSTYTVDFTANGGMDHAPSFAFALPASGLSSMGSDGDFYIDITNKKLYGPRTNGLYSLIGTLT